MGISNIHSVSGMLAAESVFCTLHEGSPLEAFWDSLKSSWIWKELHSARNYRPVSLLIDQLLVFCESNHLSLFIIQGKHISPSLQNLLL